MRTERVGGRDLQAREQVGAHAQDVSWVVGQGGQQLVDLRDVDQLPPAWMDSMTM